MNKAHKNKLVGIIIVFGLIAGAVGLVLYALKQNINLFYSPTQITQGLAPLHHRIRLGGLVEEGSLHKDPQSLKVTFQITDRTKMIPVEYTGVLPDLFREKQSVVVEGQLETSNHFIAEQVLAKHDEKYMPREVRDLLKNKL
jgi:cytochrome c-type biogenesis protein CcmE